MRRSYLAIVNPAAGGGKGRKLLNAAMQRLRSGGLEIEIAETKGPEDATGISREAYAAGFRSFIAVGGDGTSYEILNGLFPDAWQNSRVLQSAGVQKEEFKQDAAQDDARPSLGFLPLGTGNSFLRHFTDRGVEHAIEALLARRIQHCDVIRVRHREGTAYCINLLSVGFAADVATLRSRRFSKWGEAGYFLSIFLTLSAFHRRPFPVRVDSQTEFDRRPCLFLTFNNSKFTGGTMMIAPHAEVNSGFIEYVRWGPIGRLGLIRNLPGLYDGSHIEHRLAERKAVRRVQFDLAAPVDVMIDGEVMTWHLEELEVLPSALNVIV